MSELNEVLRYVREVIEKSHYGEKDTCALLEEEPQLEARFNELTLSTHSPQALYTHLGYDNLQVLYQVSCALYGRRDTRSTHVYQAMMLAQELCQ